jgi:segregation and condensation protein A
VLGALATQAFVEFTQLFSPKEGRMGVTVTFSAVLELLREGLIEIVQSEPFAPIHVRAGAPRNVTHIVYDDSADANRTEP